MITGTENDGPEKFVTLYYGYHTQNDGPERLVSWLLKTKASKDW